MKPIDQITLDDVKAMQAAKGHQIFTDGRPNIVGVRNANNTSNTFDDKIFVWWNEDGKEVSHIYSGTTNPGLNWLKQPTMAKGTAILVPGQYLNCWTLGMHRGKHLALCQTAGEVKVYRDADKDASLDMDDKTIESGYFGINLHHAGMNDADIIGLYSAGCQVWRFHQAHEDLMHDFQRLSKANHFNRFSYSLVKQEDFN